MSGRRFFCRGHGNIEDDTKGVKRCSNSKDRYYNGKKKNKDKTGIYKRLHGKLKIAQ